MMLALCGGSFAQKIAHVYTDKVLTDLPEYKEAQTEIEKRQLAAQKRLVKMDSTYKALLTEYQAGQGSMSEIKRKTMEQDITDLQQRIPQVEQEETQKINQLQQNYMASLSDKIQKSINKVAETGGYTYVIDAQVLHYVNGGIDITNDVRKDLGLAAAAE